MNRIFLVCSIIACMFSAFAHSQGELNEGPGVFSGEKGEVSLSKLFKGNKDEKTLGDENEFEQFKLWEKLKSTNDPKYQEFKMWVKYQKYLSENP